MNKKLYMVSLGCSKNLVDSEVMLGLLEKDGYQLSQDPQDADLLLINTCGFIGSAVQEAIDEILELARYKQDSTGTKLVVTGCLVQRYGGAELEKELPEVDLFIDTPIALYLPYAVLCAAVRRPTSLPKPSDWMKQGSRNSPW
jgi:ribosomal protein S12 methylthiotransferase